MHWQDYLEIVGSELFLRYRKRLMSPGISWEILGDYPGASLIDVALRVHAGRQLLREGYDFQALSAIRSGRWQASDSRQLGLSASRTRPDRLSRGQVLLGGGVFIVFCLLSISDAAGIAGLSLAGMVAALLLLRRLRAGVRRPAARPPGGCETENTACDAALSGRRDILPGL